MILEINMLILRRSLIITCECNRSGTVSSDIFALPRGTLDPPLLFILLPVEPSNPGEAFPPDSCRGLEP